MNSTKFPAVDCSNWFDFYRCDGCFRLITRVQELTGLRTKTICPCGTGKYHADNPRWYEYLLPRVWTFAILRIRGKM